MTLKQIVMLAVQLSIICTVFGFGLKATSADLLFLLRRPGLLARSLLSVFVVMPIVAVVLMSLFDFNPLVEIVLVALSISPVPPLLPNRQTKGGGNASFGLGLMAILALTSIVTAPLALQLLQFVSSRELTIAEGAIAALVFQMALLPLAAGMIVRALLPALAERLEKPVSMVGKVLAPPALIALIYGALPSMLALIGNGTLVAIVVFVVAGLAIGHVLGGPDPDDSVVLALSTACRHPAIALAIASANFPDQQFVGPLLLYLLLNAIVGIPYLVWTRRRLGSALRPA